MPWVTDEQQGTHYVRRNRKESDANTRTIIIEPNPPKAEEGQPPALELPGALPGGQEDHASSDGGSPASPGGDRLDRGLGAGPQPEASEGRREELAASERRQPEGDTPRRRVAGDGLGRLLPGERYTRES